MYAKFFHAKFYWKRLCYNYDNTMRFLLYDDDGVLLRKFWSREAADKFLQDGYTIVELKKPKRVRNTRVSVSDMFADLGEAPF